MNAAALLKNGIALEASGDLSGATAVYRKVLSREPSNIDALVRLGRAQLERGEFEASAEALGRAVKLRPGHDLALGLLGTVFMRTGKLREALVCFERAVAAAPNSTLTLLHMADALGNLGRHEDALAAIDKAAALEPGNVFAWHNRGLALEALGRDAEAAESFKRALSLHPGLAETHFSLGNVLARLQLNEEAIEHYRSALAQRPGFARGHANLGAALFKLHRWEEALQSFREAVRLQPDLAKVHEAIGQALSHLQREAESLESFDRALSLAPDDVEIMLNKALALRTLGRFDEARKLIERSLALRPENVSLHFDLSLMKRFAVGDPQIAAMENLLTEALPPDQQGNLHFALAKAYADIGDHERAFGHLLRANAIRRSQMVCDENAEFAKMERIAQVFTPAFIQSKLGQGNGSDRPIFIVGMPRSGTTLVEQILASHPHVFGAGEQKAFGEAVDSFRSAGEPSYLDMVPALTGAQFNALGSAYLSRMAKLVPDDRKFTDKMPANFEFVGLIRLALPNARIVWVKRHALDTCLSIFATNFAYPLAYAYDLGELGRYYRAYERLMDHWRQALPKDGMLEVQYEDVIADLEGQARRVVAYCGLEWNDACLNFHKTERPVRTASVAQVREPIYKTSVERWRPYEKHLAPLLEALGPSANVH